jgi:hypothetical protein
MVTTVQQSPIAYAIDARHDYDHKRLGSIYVDYWYENKHNLTYLKERETDTVISIITGKKYIVINNRVEEID